MLERHQENLEAQKALIIMGNESLELLDGSVAGVETITTFFEGVKSFGKGSLSVAQWVGGKIGNGLGKGLSTAGNGLFNLFSANDALIKSMLLTVKDSESLVFTEANLKTLTSTGEVSDLSSDLSNLLSAVKSLDKYSHELQTYLNAQLIVIKKLSSVKDAGGVAKVIEEFDNLTPPSINVFGSSNKSELLPGGKTLEFTPEPTKYIMSNSDVRATSTELDMSSGKKKELLRELQNINAMFKKIKQSYDAYSNFIKSWQTTVQSIAKNLDKLEGIPNGVQRAIESKLSGDAQALLFYSGFTPRVMTYTDSYLKTFIGVLRK